VNLSGTAAKALALKLAKEAVERFKQLDSRSRFARLSTVP
jgi:hypothetical protein